MFSCCRCTNPKKDNKLNTKKDKEKDKEKDDSNPSEDTEKKDPVTSHDTIEEDTKQESQDIIEIRLSDKNDSEDQHQCDEKESDLNGTPPPPSAVATIPDAAASPVASVTSGGDKTEPSMSDNMNTAIDKDDETIEGKKRPKSDSSNSTVEESIVVNKSKQNENDDSVDTNTISNSQSSVINNNMDLNQDQDQIQDQDNYQPQDQVENQDQQLPEQEQQLIVDEKPEQTEETKEKQENSALHQNGSYDETIAPDNGLTKLDDDKDPPDATGTAIETTASVNGSDLPKSCISRRSSSKSSIRKKVNINDSTEVIPSSELASIDDDEVFSDSIPAQLPRGDMCAPYVTKRGSIPGCFDLPDWFNNDDRFYYTEYGGILEPPVTPVGRDELALKRHRMYSELLLAAQAAVEHRVRFDPLGPDVASEDCDPDLKPSATAELEKLVNRLEKIVDRLERSVSARELEIANRAFDSVIETRRRSFDLETAELPPIPSNSEEHSVGTPPSQVIEAEEKSNGISKSPKSPEVEALAAEEEEQQQQEETIPAASKQIAKISESLDKRIDKIESCLNHINENFKKTTSDDTNNSFENIPTVLDEYLTEDSVVVVVTSDRPAPLQKQSYNISVDLSSIPVTVGDSIAVDNMSVAGYQDIVNGPLSQFINLSNKIGGDVAKQAEFVKSAFNAQQQYVTLATQIAQPPQNKQMEYLKPTSDQITAVQNFREKNRASQFFNHLSAISESIPALGWVCVSPTPGPHVKEMNDAGQFYTNRVLKDWKEKDPKHVEWARAWIQTLNELQQYIKQYHTTGLVWSGKGGAAAPPPPPPSAAGCPPPPPPPVLALGDLSLGANDERSALFAEINQGEGITKSLKKVTDDMQTHKNPTLRTGPAPFRAPQPFSSSGGISPASLPIDKPPVFNRDGKKWLIEYQKSNQGLLVENAEMNNVVYMFRCQDSTLTIKGKVNSVVMDSCKKCSLLFDAVVSSIEFVNCQSVQMQVLGKVPTISIDKTDGCQMYLSKDSMAVEIISSKSSEMNVLIPKDNGEYVEQPIPEQYKTTIRGSSLQTICVESVG